MKILVTAGPTREAIDPVRFITNHSSGKMGYAIAAAAVELGHQVTLISGPVNLTPPTGLACFQKITTAAEMAQAVYQAFANADLCIMCAAVADYRPVSAASSKIKKSDGGMVLQLERTEDILAGLGARKHPDQILAGFAAETDSVEHNAQEKLIRKNLDWIAANQVGLPDRGFQSDDNAAVLFARDGRRIEFPLCPKVQLAHQILNTILNTNHN